MLNSDSELEEDEEEILVYVEFDNCVTNDVFSSENLKIDMLGLDSDHPVMQVNGKFFQGTYEDAVGTYLFFEKDNNPTIDDPVFDQIPTLKYYDKTRKILKMQRAFVVPRYEVVGDSGHSQCIPNMETIKEAGVPPRYQEEALSFWKNSRDKRINALNEYLKKQEFRKELRQRGFEPESESDEDNPFAMYKYLENGIDMPKVAENDDENMDFNQQIEKLENTLQMTELDKQETKDVPKKLTVIDPGPSTSKSSMPWIDDDPPKESLMSQKVKSVGKVREKSIKGKIQKKTLKKKKVSSSQKTMNENSIGLSLDIPSNENISVEPDKDKDKSNENIEKNVNVQNILKPNENILNSENIRMEEMEVDDQLIEENGKLLSEELKLNASFISDKNKKKLERRETKIKELREKLKAVNQSSSQPNS